MIVYVRPRIYFENIKGTNKEKKLLDSYKVISINTPVYEPKKIHREEPPFTLLNHPNLLILYFHDYYKPLQNVILMSDEDAQKIKNFITGNEDKIYVHCTAGISRSGAVGTFLSEYFNGKYSKEHKHFLNSHWLNPNQWVYEKMKKSYGI